ncbi:MAG TPA: ATP-binding cassette domain-containing protein [Kofleriaceae bacterium]|nr:ATP-binding cassette domain-containing protein [Kofleriaceae bacterium]
MTSLRFLGVELAFDGLAPTLSDLDLHFATGWTGVVGANGAGKSTLLALATGALAPTRGRIVRDPAELMIVHCPQEVGALDDGVRAVAASDDRAARRWLGRLGCDPAELDRWSTLSPGERKRWQLAAALAAEPELLTLDEPTNHLDGAGRAALVAALARYRGIGLVVSHDRALLDELTTATVRVASGGARRYTGGYTIARAQWEADADARREARSDAVAHERRIERRLDQARRAEEAAHRQRSTGARMKSRHDSDARTMGAANLAEWAAAGAGRTVARLHGAAARAAESVAALTVEKERGGDLFVDWEPPPRRWLANLDGVDLRAGDANLLGGVRVAIERDTRVQIAGDNGAGKTTLLRALVAAASLPRDRILWLPQELEAGAGSEIVAAVRALPGSVRGRVGQIAAALGLDPARALASPSPSPGEVRKLAIALGLGRRAWLVVLDEPTNHLDLPSIERLEDALASYPGALVLVSHDAPLAGRLTREVWTVADGAVTTRKLSAACVGT